MVDGTLYQLLLLFLLFYFFLIRPELKKAKKHQAMLDDLKRGDKILTRGGLYGVITKIENENDLLVEIAGGVTVVVNKMGVLSLANESAAQVSPAQTKDSKNSKKAKK